MTMKPRTTIVEQMAWKCAKEIWPIGGPSNQEMIVNGYFAGFKAAREMAAEEIKNGGGPELFKLAGDRAICKVKHPLDCRCTPTQVEELVNRITLLGEEPADE